MPAGGGANKRDHERIKRRIPSFAVALNREWKSALRKHGDWWFGRMADRFTAPLTPYGQPNLNTKLHSRNGTLRNSMHRSVFGTKLKELGLRMWSDAPHARLQEYGGVIRPRGHKYLAIPIDDNLTPAGAPKYRSPTDPAIVDGRFLEVNGNLYYVRDAERKKNKKTQVETIGDTEFLFAMRKEVDIPGPGPGARRKGPSRLGMRETAIGTASKRQLRRRVKVGLRRALQKTFPGGGRASGG